VSPSDELASVIFAIGKWVLIAFAIGTGVLVLRLMWAWLCSLIPDDKPKDEEKS
jgi:hypothetical protein